MTNITLLGGSLGAGKTTLLLNILKSGSLSQKDGIIVMDAAGDIDYTRVYSDASERGVHLENATSACTVCDGPESVFRHLSTMQDLEHVVIELSGQMPLSVMNSGLAAKRIQNLQSVYLVDPTYFSLVQAADEIPHADVVGITKTDSSIDIKKYNPSAKVMNIQKDDTYTLSQLLSELPTKSMRLFPLSNHSHHHSESKDLISEWSHKVYNPYHSAEELETILRPLTATYDRIKGYVALDAVNIYSFDGVHGEYSHSIVNDPYLGNGVILLANGNDIYFPESQAVEQTEKLTQKPDVTPVVRRESEKHTFREYMTQALQAKQYDDAMGAGEQYEFETGEISLIQEAISPFAKGKQDLITSGNLSRSQRLRQGMSALYYLLEYTDTNIDITKTIAHHYKTDYANMTPHDWNEIQKSSNPDETIDYIHTIRAKL